MGQLSRQSEQYMQRVLDKDQDCGVLLLLPDSRDIATAGHDGREDRCVFREIGERRNYL